MEKWEEIQYVRNVEKNINYNNKNNNLYYNEDNNLCNNVNNNLSNQIECKKCKIEKDIINFYKNSKKKNGYQSYCIDCLKKLISKSSKLNNYVNIIYNKFIKNIKRKLIYTTRYN